MNPARVARHRGPGADAGRLGIPAILWAFLGTTLLVAIGDRTVWWADLARYGEASVTLFRTLTDESIGSWVQRLFLVLWAEAPLLPWLAQFLTPLGSFFPYPQTGLLILNPALQTATLAVIALALLRLRTDRGVATAAVLFLAATPFFFGMSYRFYVEPLQGLTVAGMLLLFSFDDELGWGDCLLLVLTLLGLGLLAKVSTIGFQLPFIAAIVARRLFHHAPQKAPAPAFRLPPLVRGVLLGSACLTLMSFAVWLWIHSDAVLVHLKMIPAGSELRSLGSRDPFATKVARWLWMYDSVTLLPSYRVVYLLLVVAALASLAVRRRSRHAIDLAALCSLSAIVGFIVLASTMVQEEIRFGYSLMIHAAVCMAWILREIGSIRVTTVMILLLAVQFGIVAHLASGGENLRVSLRVYQGPAELNSFALDRTLQTSRALCRESASRRIVIGSRNASLDDHALLFYARLDGDWQCDFGFGTIPAPENRSLEEVYEEMLSVPFDLIAFDTADLPGSRVAPFDAVQAFLLEEIAQNPEFTLRSRNDAGIEVYERHPRQDRSFEASYPAIGRDPATDFAGYLDFPRAGRLKAGTRRIQGWALGPSGIVALEICIESADRRWRQCVDRADLPGTQKRPDLVAAFPGATHALHGGFSGSFTVPPVAGLHQLTVTAAWRNGVRTTLARVTVDIVP